MDKKISKKKRKILDSKTSSLTRRRRRHKVSLSLLAVLYIYIRARTKSAFSKKTKRDRAFTSFSEDDEEENIVIPIGFFPLVFCAIGSASSCAFKSHHHDGRAGEEEAKDVRK